MVRDLYACCHGGKRSSRITVQSPLPQITFCAAVMPRLNFSLGRCNNERKPSRRITSVVAAVKREVRRLWSRKSDLHLKVLTVVPTYYHCGFIAAWRMLSKSHHAPPKVSLQLFARFGVLLHRRFGQIRSTWKRADPDGFRTNIRDLTRAKKCVI